jgi:hypothetical protein
MKKLIIFAFLLAAIGAHAQLTKIKSKSALADSIWLPKGARECQPIIVTTYGDTARSFYYNVDFGRDTTSTVTITPMVFNKQGTQLRIETLTMPGASYRKWGLLIVPLDAYIHNQFPRITPL